MYENLKDKFTQAIVPLDEYLKTYDVFLPILRNNADDFTRALEIREEPLEIEDISNMIIDVYKKKDQLKEQIPEVIKVSCFEIHTKLLLIDLE